MIKSKKISNILDLKKFDYNDFEKKALKLTRIIIKKNLKDYIFFNTFNFTPALERHLLSYIVENRNYLMDKVLNEKDIWKDLVDLYYKRKIIFLLSRKTFYILKTTKVFLKKLSNFFSIYRSRKNITDTVLIINHPKFLDFFIKNDFLNNNITWLCISNYGAIKKRLPNSEIVIPLIESWGFPSQIPVIGPLIDLFHDIKNFIVIHKPKLVITIEGDAQFHSLISLICNRNQIKNICLQWGIFYENWREVAFANMEFTYFLTWGKYFTNQLIPLNPKTKFLEFGYPLKVSTENNNLIKKNKIVCIGESISQHITYDFYCDYINLIIKLKKLIPYLEIIYRPHPSHRLRKFENNLIYNEIFVRNNCNLIEELSNSIICLGITSSSLTEALLVNSIPISFNKSLKKISIPIQKESLGIESDSEQFILKKIEEFINSKSLCDTYRKSIIDKKNYFFKERKSIKLLEQIKII